MNLNYTHLKDAVWDYGEQHISRIIGAKIRWKKIPWADLACDNLSLECEVKMRHVSQSVLIGISQYYQMFHRAEAGIDQYYALCFYNTRDGKRMGVSAPIWKMMSQEEIQRAKINFIRKVQIQTIFLFPLPNIFDFFAGRLNHSTGEVITEKYHGTVWSSNIWPIREYYDWLDSNQKSSIEMGGLSSTRPNMKVHMIGEAMIQRVGSIIWWL